MHAVRMWVSATLAVCLLLGCSAGRTSRWDSGGLPNTGAAGGESPEALVTQGDAAWQRRDDAPSLKAAIAAWEKVVAARPNDHATYTKLSHAYYFLADAHLRDKSQAEAYLSTFEKGVAAGERALAEANPRFKQRMLAGDKVDDAIKEVGMEGIEAMYWYAASLGKWARAKGFAATVGNKDRIRSVMQRVLDLDPTFYHGAAHRYFGAYYAVAPGFAGGDMNKSREHFEKSLQLAPQYAGTKVLMADVYAVKKQERALFDRLLDEVLAMPENAIPGLEPETRVEKQKATELKAKAAELF